MIQPIAFGATLGIHPLAVLIVTIAAAACSARSASSWRRR
jgi:predicted PurR-regulated permease PerM